MKPPPKLQFQYHGRTVAAIGYGDPCPANVNLWDLYRIDGVLCFVVGLRPEHDDTTLIVDVLTCSPKWALKYSLDTARRAP